jgi:hypothetical protein
MLNRCCCKAFLTPGRVRSVLIRRYVDWRRLPTAGAFMGFSGLIPGEYSSGERSRCRRSHHQGRPDRPADRAHRGGLGIPSTGRGSGSRCPAPRPVPVRRHWPDRGPPSNWLHAKYKKAQRLPGVPASAVWVGRSGSCWSEASGGQGGATTAWAGRGRGTEAWRQSSGPTQPDRSARLATSWPRLFPPR